MEPTISIWYPFQSFAPLSPLEYPKCRDVDPSTYGSGKGRGVQCSDLGCSEAPPKGMAPANFDELFTVLEYLKPRDLVNTWKALLEGCKTCFFVVLLDCSWVEHFSGKWCVLVPDVQDAVGLEEMKQDWQARYNAPTAIHRRFLCRTAIEIGRRQERWNMSGKTLQMHMFDSK